MLTRSIEKSARTFSRVGELSTNKDFQSSSMVLAECGSWPRGFRLAFAMLEDYVIVLPKYGFNFFPKSSSWYITGSVLNVATFLLLRSKHDLFARGYELGPGTSKEHVHIARARFYLPKKDKCA